MSSASGNHTNRSALTLAALGVVFGDIGTSPLYTLKEVFSVGVHPVPLSEVNMFGILSLIVWALILVVSIKYVAFIMRADNRGEGGIMALLALASRNVANDEKKTAQYYAVRHSRGLYVLCRWHHHPRDLSIICSRGLGSLRTSVASVDITNHPHRIIPLILGTKQRHSISRRFFWANHVTVV